jgi:CBS domain-containing protein
MTKLSRKRREINDIPVLIQTILKKPVTANQNTPILDARDTLLKHNISRLIVVSGNRPVGIITEKDISRGLSVFAQKPISKVTVSDLMSDNLITANIDDQITKCAKLMMENKISSIIILNRDKTLAGIITKTDLVSVFLIQGTATTLISKIMSRKPITVSPQDSIFEVQSILVNNKISRVIVEKNKKVEGIITYRDFVPARTYHYESQFVDPSERKEVMWNPHLNEFNVNRLDYLLAFKAKDIMTPNPLVVYTDDVVYTAAIIMIRNQISGLPVLRNSKLSGIITKTDIVNILAKKGLI